MSLKFASDNLLDSYNVLRQGKVYENVGNEKDGCLKYKKYTRSLLACFSKILRVKATFIVESVKCKHRTSFILKGFLMLRMRSCTNFIYI